MMLKKELKIDKAIYLIDDASKTYIFLKRNPDWKSLTSKENELNKKHIDGYRRILKDGSTRRYKLSIKKRIKINKEWHKKNRMSKNPTLEERIKWHLKHAKNCA